MNIFEAQNIVKNFESHTALNDVSIAVPKQNIFGLLGPNGAGKTTLIRIINQIITPDKGLLLFNNEPLKLKHINQIGYLPEERGLYKKMKVGEQLLYLSQLKGVSKQESEKRLTQWLQKFDIEEWRNKTIEELSKGMQQKIQFIATVLHQPQLLVLDEPFSGFDPINATLIKEEILRLKANGTTIILSTHNMSSVEELCDNIALIHKSKNIINGSVKDIRKAYKTNIYEIEFTGSIFAFTAALGSKFELIKHTKQEDNVFKVKVKILEQSTANNLIERALTTVNIHSFKELIPDMNSIFIATINAANTHTPELATNLFSTLQN